MCGARQVRIVIPELYVCAGTFSTCTSVEVNHEHCSVTIVYIMWPFSGVRGAIGSVRDMLNHERK